MILISDKGEIEKVFGGNVLKFPHEVAVNSIGDILVANMNSNSAVIFNAKDGYDTHNEIKFPISYGKPKTITDIGLNHFRVGFTGNGSAYFLDLEKIQSNDGSFDKANLLNNKISIRTNQNSNYLSAQNRLKISNSNIFTKSSKYKIFIIN